MKEALHSMVDEVSDAQSDLASHSYAGCDTAEEPLFVCFPGSPDQIRRVILYCNRVNIPIIPRGLGSSIVGGTLAGNGIVLNMTRMNKVFRIDHTKKEVELEPGVLLDSLNRHLRKEGYALPVQPYFSRFHTIGGLVATNACGPWSYRHGRLETWVREVSFLDGTGKYYEIHEGLQRVVGREGTTGIIVKLRMGLLPSLARASATIHSYRNLASLFAILADLKKDASIVAIDYLNRMSSVFVGLSDEHHLVVEYADQGGEIREEPLLSRTLSKREDVHDALRLKGYFHLDDAQAAGEKLLDVLAFADEHDLPVFGPIGLDSVFVFFKKKDALRDQFHEMARMRVFALGTLTGWGRVKKEFTPYDVKNALIKLKDEYDYNNILNRGKVVDFR